VVAHEPKPCEAYRRLLREHEELVHITVETRRCEQEDSRAAAC